MLEKCAEIRNHFSDYLDGECEPQALKSIRFHLDQCDPCRRELEAWETMRADLQDLPRHPVPADLALRLRVEVSRNLHRNTAGRLRMWVGNVLQPMLLPASGGLLAAMICFCLIMGSLVVPATNTPDVPLGFETPPRVVELAPLDFMGDTPLVLVTRVDAGGRVMGYKVLSGESSPELMHQLDRVIYFSLFQPATSFGRPTDGQVVLSLRRINVRG